MQTVFARNALLPEGWCENVTVRIHESGRIAGIDRNSNQGHAESVATLLAASSNLHSHTFQRAMAGLAERRGPVGHDSFWTWREIMYRFLDLLSPDDIEAIAAFAFMEMQEAGFGAVAEFHYLHHQAGGTPFDAIGETSARIVAAAAEAGIGLTLLPVLYRYGGVDRRSLEGGQQRFGNDLSQFARLLDEAERHLALLPGDATLGIAPHSLRAVPPADIAELTSLRPNAPFHMHIAEQEAEIAEVRDACGKRPVAWLLDNVEVDKRWCLIHCTHMDDEETNRLAATGAVAGLCPVTEANLGDGVFNADRYLNAGGRLGIGSDSNIRITVAEELRQLEYSQRLRDRARIVLAPPGRSAGRTLHDAALAGGAQALDRHSGALEAGFWADMVAIDPTIHAGPDTGDTMLDGWIFTGDNRAVTDLWSAGRHCVRAGRHVNRERIATRYHQVVTGLRERL